MTIQPETLEKIADTILLRLRDADAAESARLLQMNDYHGFLKAKMPEDFLHQILSPLGLTPTDVQIEIVKVDRDLSKEIHYHDESFAYCVCLGGEYRTDDPRNAKAFVGDHWFPVHAGDVVKIPPKTPHGFTVENDGVLVFLSVQAPPIERGGQDDYHKVEN